MKFNQSVTNPMLVGAIQLFRAEDTPEHRELLEDEIFKGKYMTPASVFPEPEPDASGEPVLKQGCKVEFPMLTSPEGKKFFMAYTDKMEMDKWRKKEAEKEKEVPNHFMLNFGDFMALFFQRGPQGEPHPAAGFVINPFGESITVPKEIAMAIYAKKMAKNRK